METFLRYILPALIGATAALIAAGLSIRVQNTRIVKDDNTSLCATLMNERKQFVAEIHDLQKRCDALEQTNIEQATEMSNLQIRNQQLIHEIKHFGSTLPDEKT